jgi:hypothetical protein
VAALARRKLPGVRIILSTWLFDEGEWQGLNRAFTAKKPWADLILAEGTTRPMPAGLPLIGFPEISMYKTFPWGGFGATPLTRRAEVQWNAVKQRCAGGFPYSEGIFEDVTKAVMSQLYWSDRPAAETVREYIAFEFSPEVVDDIVKVIGTLEQNHHMRWWPGELEGVKLDQDWFPTRGAKPQADPGAEEAYVTVLDAIGRLSPQARAAWRWRLLYLRTLLDAQLQANGGKPNAHCKDAFAELIEIYHARSANPCLRPPLDGEAGLETEQPAGGKRSGLPDAVPPTNKADKVRIRAVQDTSGKTRYEFVAGDLSGEIAAHEHHYGIVRLVHQASGKNIVCPDKCILNAEYYLSPNSPQHVAAWGPGGGYCGSFNPELTATVGGQHLRRRWLRVKRVAPKTGRANHEGYDYAMDTSPQRDVRFATQPGSPGGGCPRNRACGFRSPHLPAHPGRRAGRARPGRNVAGQPQSASQSPGGGHRRFAVVRLPCAGPVACPATADRRRDRRGPGEGFRTSGRLAG